MPAVAEEKKAAPSAKHAEMRCKVCGCTEANACDPPCGWSDIEDCLCTNCEDAAETLVEWAIGAHRANMAALMRLFNARLGDVRYRLAPEDREDSTEGAQGGQS